MSSTPGGELLDPDGIGGLSMAQQNGGEQDPFAETDANALAKACSFVVALGAACPVARARELVARLSLMLAPVLLELATPGARADATGVTRELLGATPRPASARCGSANWLHSYVGVKALVC